MQTPDETGGKKARCPNCQNLAPIPYYSTSPLPRSPATLAQPVISTLLAGQPLNPFRDTLASPAAGVLAAPNPYVSPTNPSAAFRPPTRTEVRRRLMIPAISMLLFGAGGLIFMLLAIYATIFEARIEQFPGETIGVVGLFVAMSVPPLLMLLGAIAMLRGRNSTAAWAGSIAAVVPCSIAFPLAVPFGVWAIMVLFDPHVELVLDSWD
jgi:hypothetical protein